MSSYDSFATAQQKCMIEYTGQLNSWSVPTHWKQWSKFYEHRTKNRNTLLHTQLFTYVFLIVQFCLSVQNWLYTSLKQIQFQKLKGKSHKGKTSIGQNLSNRKLLIGKITMQCRPQNWTEKETVVYFCECKNKHWKLCLAFSQA